MVILYILLWSDLVFIQNVVAGVQSRLAYDLQFTIGRKNLFARCILVELDTISLSLLALSFSPSYLFLGRLDSWILRFENVETDPLSAAGVPLTFLVLRKC